MRRSQSRRTLLAHRRSRDQFRHSLTASDASWWLVRTAGRRSRTSSSARRRVSLPRNGRQHTVHPPHTTLSVTTATMLRARPPFRQERPAIGTRRPGGLLLRGQTTCGGPRTESISSVIAPHPARLARRAASTWPRQGVCASTLPRQLIIIQLPDHDTLWLIRHRQPGGHLVGLRMLRSG